MGGTAIKELKRKLDQIILLLESGDFESASNIMGQIQNLDFSRLSKEDIEYLIRSISNLENKVKSKQEDILKAISKKNDMKKYRY